MRFNPKKYIGDKAVGALREREREREIFFSNLRTGKISEEKSHEFFDRLLLIRKCSDRNKKAEWPATDKIHPREQRMIVKTYYCLVAAVYFLAHVQCSLSASMEQVRLI